MTPCERVAETIIDFVSSRFHFDSLAHDNSATDSNVLSVETSTEARGQTPSPILLHGTQSVPKFNSTTADEVTIFLALYRVESKKVDLVMTMNVPTKTSDGGAVNADGLAAAKHDFGMAAASLNIVDFGLFV